MPDLLRPHCLQHSTLACPSLSPRVCSNSCLLVMPSNHLILQCPLLLPHSVFPSIRVFSNESALRIRWPKCWSFSFALVLPLSETVQVCPLELRGGHGGWSLAYKKWGTERPLCLGAPQGLAWFAKVPTAFQRIEIFSIRRIF